MVDGRPAGSSGDGSFGGGGVVEVFVLNRDYRDMITLLNEHDVEYMLIGAYALAFHGVPRTTGDIDFFVRCSRENSERIFRALAEFGAPIAAIDPHYLAQYGNMFQVGVAPCRIDIITQADGIRFEDITPLVAEVDGLRLPVIPREDFIRNKSAIGRYKDLADLESLRDGA